METQTSRGAAGVQGECGPPSAALSLADGLRAGLPIAVGYIPIAIAFGLVARSAGVPNHVTIFMSLVVFAGASQFVGVSLMASGALPWEIALTTLIINLRHLLMSASISRRVGPGRLSRFMPAIAFGITDETFSVASFRREDRVSPEFLLGLNLLAFSAWNVGTWAGLFLSAGLPEIIKSGMGIALYAMFIGLLVPALRNSAPLLAVCALAVAVNSLLHWAPFFSGLSQGWGIIISTLTAAAAGSFFFPGGAGGE